MQNLKLLEKEINRFSKLNEGNNIDIEDIQRLLRIIKKVKQELRKNNI